MARTPSTMLPLGTVCPDFSLPDVDNHLVSLADFGGQPALLVVFMCNHCPFVKHIATGLAQFAHEYQPKGLAVIGINSNDAKAHPDDSPAKMKDEVKLRSYTFPYLFDEQQAVAKVFKAACTPDFFLFDKRRVLAYRGQFDPSRPDNGIPVTGKDMRAAVDALLSGGSPPAEQHPSIGCNIKWIPGNEPDYFK